MNKQTKYSPAQMKYKFKSNVTNTSDENNKKEFKVLGINENEYILKTCFKCKKELVTIEVKAPAPYNTKIVCKECGGFIKWGESTISLELKDKINWFFENVDINRNKYYMSLFYQWMKKKTLTTKQLEVLYQHEMFPNSPVTYEFNDEKEQKEVKEKFKKAEEKEQKEKSEFMVKMKKCTEFDEV